MKRTRIKRGTKRLARGSKSLKRTPLARVSKLSAGSKMKRGKRLRVVGKRGRAIRKTLAELRPLVFERDEHICRRCLDPKCLPLDPHHLRGRGRGGEHTLSNLVTLGRPCHDAIETHRAPDWREWKRSGKGAQHA